MGRIRVNADEIRLRAKNLRRLFRLRRCRLLRDRNRARADGTGKESEKATAHGAPLPNRRVRLAPISLR